MMKKTVSVLLVMSLSATLIAGCGANGDSSGSDSTDSGDEVVIEFQQWFDNEMDEGYLQSVCDDFYEETGIKVELLSNPYADTQAQMQASAAAGTLADVVALDGGWIYDYATQGMLADLSELYDEIGFDTSDITSQTEVNGTVYAQPIVNFPCLMAVNLDILEEAGITELPETWSEFLDTCIQVTDPDKNVYGFGMNMSTDNSTCMEYFAAFAWNSGCSIIGEDGKPFLANNDVWIETTEFFKSLFDNGVTLPGMYTLTDADKVQEFVNGRIAFMPDSVAHLTNIQEQAPEMNITYINMPHKDDYDGENYMRANNWACGISENSEHKEEAAQFIQYLLGAEVNADLCVHAGGFPVNATSEPAYDNDSEAFKAIQEIYGTTTGVAEFYSFPTAEALMRTLDENLVMYLDGDYATAEEMMEVVQQEFDAAYE